MKMNNWCPPWKKSVLSLKVLCKKCLYLKKALLWFYRPSTYTFAGDHALGHIYNCLDNKNNCTTTILRFGGKSASNATVIAYYLLNFYCIFFSFSFLLFAHQLPSFLNNNFRFWPREQNTFANGSFWNCFHLKTPKDLMHSWKHTSPDEPRLNCKLYLLYTFGCRDRESLSIPREWFVQ